MIAIKATTVRFPGDLYEQIEATALRDRRSVASEILWLVERGLAAEQS